MTTDQTTRDNVPDVVALAADSVLRVWADPMQDEWVPASVAEGARIELARREAQQAQVQVPTRAWSI
jgi:hypothetical protein